ncbi:MAG: ABC transporter permease [Armatimonadota bacterium]|nr:ABC transporter permease [Armatimonadota bacterium]
MARYLVGRLVAVFPVLVGVSFIVLLVMHLIPGDPAVVIAGVGASGEDIETIRRQLGLDRPFLLQYITWVNNMLRGDWGRSAVTREAVLPLLASRVQYTALLAAVGVVLAVGAGVPLGVLAAVRRNQPLDYGATMVALVGISAPIFWIGLVLQLLFAVRLGWLPTSGAGTWRHLVLPAIAIAANSTAILTRMTRSSLLEVLGQDYVRTAHSKGCARRRVIGHHALRNALIPIVTVIGLQFGYLLGGAVLTETVFVWPGVGRLLADAIFRRDFPVVQGAVMLIAVAFVFVNLLTDLAYAYLDPRVRYA